MATTNVQMIRCASCGTVNRVPGDKIEKGQEPICGRCKAPLNATGAPVVVTDRTFAEEVERSPLPVLLDLWAPWCGPCKMIAPVLDELATQLAGRVRIAKLNVDDNPVTSGRFNVRSIPSLLVLKNGQEMDRIVGVQPKSEILRRLEQFIS
jgi:thioredoxin